jgi:hypothetical protein
MTTSKTPPPEVPKWDPYAASIRAWDSVRHKIAQDYNTSPTDPVVQIVAALLVHNVWSNDK